MPNRQSTRAQALVNTNSNVRTDRSAGQGFLNARLATAPELSLRRQTALRDWLAATLAVASQQLLPFGIKLTPPWFAAMCLLAGTAIFVSYWAYPRLSLRRFRVTEQWMMLLAWTTTAALVYASGGADSPYIFFYAQTMIYSAYFFARSKLAVRHIVLGSIAALLPLAYDYSRAMNDSFLPTIVIALAVWWSICLLIAVSRRARLAAEREARRGALADPLTGVANLRAVDEFTAELTDDRRPFAVVMVDLDGLKLANTRFGHAGGDELICRLAAALRMASGDDAQVARTGGDEFVVIIPDADQSTTESWRERFAVGLSRDNGDNPASKPRLSASVGAAVAPRDGTDLAELMRVADSRMYEQKFAQTDQKVIPIDSMVRGGHKIERFTTVSAQRKIDRIADLRAPAGAIVSTLIAIAVGLAVHLSGGSESVLVSVVLVAIAYVSYFASRRSAIYGVAAILAAFTAAYFSLGASTPIEQTRYLTIVFGSLSIAWALQGNGSMLSAARSRAVELSTIDALTGVRNRRAFESDLLQAIERFEQVGEAVTTRPELMLVDIDRFKDANTMLGHQGGDMLLKDVANALCEAAGEEGAVYRIGGDEFAVITVGTDQQIQAIARRGDAAVAAIDHERRYAGQGVDVSISCGTSHFTPARGLAGMMADADSAMMAAKERPPAVVRLPSREVRSIA